MLCLEKDNGNASRKEKINSIGIHSRIIKVLIYLVNLFFRIFIILETMPFSPYSQNLLRTTIFWSDSSISLVLLFIL